MCWHLHEERCRRSFLRRENDVGVSPLRLPGPRATSPVQMWLASRSFHHSNWDCLKWQSAHHGDGLAAVLFLLLKESDLVARVVTELESVGEHTTCKQPTGATFYNIHETFFIRVLCVQDFAFHFISTRVIKVFLVDILIFKTFITAVDALKLLCTRFHFYQTHIAAVPKRQK